MGAHQISSATSVRIAALSGNTRGIGLVFVSTFGRTALHALVRLVSAEIHPFQVAFFQNFFGLFVVLPWFIRRGLEPLRTTRFPLHLLRVLITLVSQLGLFYALSVTPLALIAALGFTVPIFTTLLAMVFLRESVGLKRWLAVFGGFAGTLVILRPGFVDVSLGAMVMIGASLIFSFAILITKLLSRTESTVTLTSYSVVLLAPMNLLIATFVWEWPSWGILGLCVAVGIVATTTQLLFNQGLKEAEVNVLMPLDFFKLIWASVIGYAFFSEIPSIWTWVGGIMICASATYVAWRESTSVASVTQQPTSPIYPEVPQSPHLPRSPRSTELGS